MKSVYVYVKRAWSALAPKLVAFLATGLTTSGLLWFLQGLGLVISAELAALVVGGLSSVAAYIQRDGLLQLAPGQFSLKVVSFIITSASATTVLAVASAFGVDLSPHAPLIGALLTVLATLVGYVKTDTFGAGR